MFGYIVRRLVWIAITLIGVSMLTFGIIFAGPTDAAQALSGGKSQGATVQMLRERLGLDRPIHEQYLTYLGNLLQGNLGLGGEGHVAGRQRLDDGKGLQLEGGVALLTISNPEVRNGLTAEMGHELVEICDEIEIDTLDGTVIKKDAELAYTSGYLGLLASNSKVAFDDINFNVQQ